MELTVLERLVIMGLLPKESNFLTMKLMRKFRESLSFSDFELKRLNIEQVGEHVKWDESANIVKDVKIGETMNALLVKTLKDRNDDDKLTNEHFTLYEKFVDNEPAPVEEPELIH